MKISNLVLVALAAGTLGASQLDCLRFQEKRLASSKTVLMEKCSFLIDGQDVWEKYGKNPEILTTINANMFKDREGNFYNCNEEDYCKELLL